MRTLVAMFFILVMAGTLLAHHGTGTYDSTKSVTLTGSVTEFAFTNPETRPTRQEMSLYLMKK